jgi:hypothetical protein
LVASDQESANIRQEIVLIESGWKVDGKWMESGWKRLQKASRQKTLRLTFYHEANIFEIKLIDFTSWVKQISSHLASADYGKDLASVKILLKKHGEIETDVARHAYRCLEKQLSKNNPFMTDNFRQRTINVVQRYRSFRDLLKIRRAKLNDSLLLHEILRVIQIEMMWINENYPLVSSRKLGNNLRESQSLLKPHVAFKKKYRHNNL